MDRIVLAHSGAFRTTVAIPWLAEKYRAEVVSVTLDLGCAKELDSVHARARAMGASRAHVIEAADEFARDVVLPALHAGATDRRMPLSTALAWPIIARHLVEIAQIEGATRIAHGCAIETGDAACLEQLVRSLHPSAKFIALARRFPAPSMTAYARQHGIAAPAAGAVRHSTDINLWGRRVDSDAGTPALTKPLAATPDEAAVVEIEFQQGVPVSINGVEMPLVELIQSLDTIAGAHGVGRVDAGAGQVYEAPAAAALQAAHVALRASVADAAPAPTAAYVDLIHNGLWFTPARAAIDAAVSEAEEHVTGVVRLHLHKGVCRVIGSSSPAAAPAAVVVSREQGA